jgi:hypothetical protein
MLLDRFGVVNRQLKPRKLTKLFFGGMAVLHTGKKLLSRL